MFERVEKCYLTAAPISGYLEDIQRSLFFTKEKEKYPILLLSFSRRTFMLVPWLAES